MSTTKRAPIRYFGGKWRLAPWIIEHLPAHQCYIEPCCGGASVLMRKPPATIEVMADISGDVVNWWTVLREQTDELVRALALTPYAYAEFDLAHHVADDPIERARRFFIRSCQGVGGTRGHSNERGGSRRTGWRRTVPRYERRPCIGDEWNADNLLQALYGAADRLRRVGIEQADWREVVGRYDSPSTLVYIDPPYVRSKRSPGLEYAIEWDDEAHVAAIEVLRGLDAMVVVSGYRCDIYDEHLEGWTRLDRIAQTNGGMANGGVKKTESIWLSPSAAALMRQQRLF